MKEIDKRLIDTISRYIASGIEQQVDYEKFYLYSLITHSTALLEKRILQYQGSMDDTVSDTAKADDKMLSGTTIRRVSLDKNGYWKII